MLTWTWWPFTTTGEGGDARTHECAAPGRGSTEPEGDPAGAGQVRRRCREGPWVSGGSAGPACSGTTTQRAGLPTQVALVARGEVPAVEHTLSSRVRPARSRAADTLTQVSAPCDRCDLDHLADGLHRLLALRPVEAVDIEHAVEVVHLVLEAAGHELLPLDDDLLAVEVDPLDAGVPGALGGEPQAGDGQAALVAVLVLVLGDLDETRVEDVADVVLDVPRERPQAHPDLVGGQAGPALVVDRLEQVLHQRLDAVVDLRDRFARGTQDRVAHDADVSHCHGNQFPTARAMLGNRAYVAASAPRAAWRPEKRQPPRKVPSSER